MVGYYHIHHYQDTAQGIWSVIEDSNVLPSDARKVLAEPIEIWVTPVRKGRCWSKIHKTRVSCPNGWLIQ